MNKVQFSVTLSQALYTVEGTSLTHGPLAWLMLVENVPRISWHLLEADILALRLTATLWSCQATVLIGRCRPITFDHRVPFDRAVEWSWLGRLFH